MLTSIICLRTFDKEWLTATASKRSTCTFRTIVPDMNFGFLVCTVKRIICQGAFQSVEAVEVDSSFREKLDTTLELFCCDIFMTDAYMYALDSGNIVTTTTMMMMRELLQLNGPMERRTIQWNKLCNRFDCSLVKWYEDTSGNHWSTNVVVILPWSQHTTSKAQQATE